MTSVGQLLRKRREAFGAGLQEAARWCDMTPEWLEDKEDCDDLSSTDFERICQGLAISPAALLRGESDSPTKGPARFRSSLQDAGMFEPHDLRLVAAASEVGRVLGGLLAMQDKYISFDRYRDIRGPSESLESWEDGYNLGEAARELFGCHPGPIPHLEGLLNNRGVHIARVEFRTPGIEGANVWESGAVPVILLNKDARRVVYSLSRRAILAHELCHLMHDGGEAQIATRATSSEGTGNHAEAVEQRARAFAPAFLATRKEVREWANIEGLPEDPVALVIRLASQWGMSFQGANWHAKNCGLINPDIADQIDAMGKQPTLPAERFEANESGSSPLMAHPELPKDPAPLMEGWAARLVVEALEAHVISLGRAKELLAWRSPA